jgi:hypothetical protein
MIRFFIRENLWLKIDQKVLNYTASSPSPKQNLRSISTF